MGWVDDVLESIQYIEENLLGAIDAQVVADHVLSSKDHFQWVFGVVTGFTVGEYIRNRRLSQAGRELLLSGAKVLDIALKYGYESPESFARAFTRFHGCTPSAARAARQALRVFHPITIQVHVKGGFNMSKQVLDVRRVGLRKDLNDDKRSPESFAFPACLTSLMECVGEDVGWETIRAHDRDWTQRFLYKQILAATGMSFGLLWHPEICPSSFDLMQVNDHAETIRRGFAYVGYECEIVGPDAGAGRLRQMLLDSIDAGKPVLAFGIAGDPECRILCGYEDDGAGVLGYRYFAGDRKDAQMLDNGMFRLDDWEKDVWTLVICGKKKQAETALHPVLECGIHIMELSEIDGYLAGDAAYDAWISYVRDEVYTDMDEKALRGRYWFHYTLTGNHAEARAYLGNYLMSEANGDERLIRAAQCMNDIHSACWKLWGVAGGVSAADGYLCLRDHAKRDELAQIIGEIRTLDNKGKEAMTQWLMQF